MSWNRTNHTQIFSLLLYLLSYHGLLSCQCEASWPSQSIRQGQVLIILVLQSSIPQQTGGSSPRRILICLWIISRRFAKLASLSSNSWVADIKTLFGQENGFRSLTSCFTDKCACHWHYSLHNLAEHTGFEPVRRFLNDGLANRSRNHLSNVPYIW